MPDRIAALPKDPRGYPIPWGILKGPDGTAFFTINDDRLHWRAVKEGLCPICGERLGRWKWFVGGPKSAFDGDGWYIDPPMHHDCAQYALATCPYLAAPRWLAKQGVYIPKAEKLVPEYRALVDPTQDMTRPIVFVAVASAQVVLHKRGPRGLLAPFIRPLWPLLSYEFWHLGHQVALSDALPLLREALGPDWMPPPTLDDLAAQAP
jgi:hypothetical protein